jgi:hypothetical protein
MCKGYVAHRAITHCSHQCICSSYLQNWKNQKIKIRHGNSRGRQTGNVTRNSLFQLNSYFRETEV